MSGENPEMMYAVSSYELGYLQNNDRNTCIDKLNDDCLKHIFMLLPIVDRIRIKKVCKRWKIITEQCWYSIKTLYISSPNICLYSSDIHRFSKPDKVKLEPLFAKCGQYIRNFNLFQSTENKYNSIFDEIIQFCPNLTSITILNYLPYEVQKCTEAYYYGHDELYKRAKCTFPHKYQHQYGIIVYDSPDHWCLEVNISVLLEKYRNLESLSLRYCSDLFGKTFFYLPTQRLQTLIFEHCFINDTNFSIVLKQLTNLKHLEIHKCGYVSKSMEAIKYCTNLKILKINLGSRTYREQFNLKGECMLSFTHLTKLQILKLWHISNLSDTDIADIVLHCHQLTCIDIKGYCPKVTDIGLETIATLPKLEKLFISLLCSVTDNGLRNIRNLKEFKCICGRITKDGISSIIESSPQLQLLNIAHHNIKHEYVTHIKELFPRLIVVSVYDKINFI